MRLWLDAVAGHVTAGALVLDVGCGTGRFAVPFARDLGVRVVGVEPSRKMLAQAEPHPAVRYVLGCGECLPLDDGAADFAFLSMVLHHFRDLAAACRELRRVLRPGARVFVRNSYGDLVDYEDFFRFFKEARGIDAARIPTFRCAVDAFTDAGFALVDQREIVQCVDPSLTAHLARLQHRPYSTFHLMSEEQIQRGFERLERAARAEREPTPVQDRIRVLVFA